MYKKKKTNLNKKLQNQTPFDSNSLLFYLVDANEEEEKDIQDWFLWILKATDLEEDSIPRYLYFVLIIWFLWKYWRCKTVFDKDFSIPYNPAWVILNYKKDWVQANSICFKQKKMNLNFIAWTPPLPGWTKLNVDGSRSIVWTL
ncbi:hypothetical protein ACOSQ4_009065 [Xanthoceras sorbifolium]